MEVQFCVRAMDAEVCVCVCVNTSALQMRSSLNCPLQDNDPLPAIANEWEQFESQSIVRGICLQMGNLWQAFVIVGHCLATLSLC